MTKIPFVISEQKTKDKKFKYPLDFKESFNSKNSNGGFFRIPTPKSLLFKSTIITPRSSWSLTYPGTWLVKFRLFSDNTGPVMRCLLFFAALISRNIYFGSIYTKYLFILSFVISNKTKMSNFLF